MGKLLHFLNDKALPDYAKTCTVQLIPSISISHDTVENI